MPPEILTRVLEGEHFNVDQRKSLGLWPSETLQYSEVLVHLAAILDCRQWFPRKAVVPTGGPVSSGVYVHRDAPDRFVCYFQRARADKPHLIAERTSAEFNTPFDAAAYYLKWDLGLPGNLDGWQVVQDLRILKEENLTRQS